MDAEIEDLLAEAREMLGDDCTGTSGPQSKADRKASLVFRSPGQALNSPVSSDGEWDVVDEDLGVVSMEEEEGEDGDEEGKSEDGGRDARQEPPASRSGLDTTDPSQLAVTIRDGLSEPGHELERYTFIVMSVGMETAARVYTQTIQTEQAGGILTGDELRRRSAGGVFFQLLKAAATQEQIRAINKFRKDRQKQGALHKQSALRSHQQPRPRPRKTEGKRMANAGAKRKGRRNQPEKNSRRILGPTDSGSGLIRKSGSCVPSSSLHNARRAGHAGVGGGRRVDRALDAR